jgi:hypothetical protein
MPPRALGRKARCRALRGAYRAPRAVVPVSRLGPEPFVQPGFVWEQRSEMPVHVRQNVLEKAGQGVDRAQQPEPTTRWSVVEAYGEGYVGVEVGWRRSNVELELRHFIATAERLLVGGMTLIPAISADQGRNLARKPEASL